MVAVDFDTFVSHEIGHLTTHAHYGAGVGRVTIIPDGSGRYGGSADPGDEGCVTERVVRWVSGQVAEGKSFARRDRTEQDIKNADDIIRAEVVKDTTLSKDEIEERVEQGFAESWKTAAKVLVERRHFYKAAVNKVREELEPQLPLDGKRILKTKFGELWESVTGEVLPSELKPYG